MTISPRTRRMFLPALLAALLPAAASADELLAGVAGRNRLVLFSSSEPSIAEVVKLAGLAPGESVLGLDVRPATGQLYALGSSNRLYTIDVSTGLATAVGDAPFATALSGTSFGFDFNPAVDRIRIVSDTGQNLRAHPDTGAIVFLDLPLAYASGDANFGTTPTVTGAAYVNNDNDPATATTLFDIDEALGVLAAQSPPNDGVLTTRGSLGVEVVRVAGFDVSGSDGTAYAAIVAESPAAVPSDRATLYTIDLETGEATRIGKIGGPKGLGSLTALGSMD